MRLSRLALLLCLLLSVAAARASETPAEHAANVYAQQEVSSTPLHTNLADYSLTPDELAKSQHLSNIHVTMHFAEEAWGILSLILLLSLGVIARIRDIAVGLSSNRWVQGFAFLLLYMLVGTVVGLPVDLYSHHLSLAYGLSVQGWGSWVWDIAKSLAIGWVLGGLLLMLGFLIIRKFPRTWWLVGWAIAVPLILLSIFAGPYFNYAFNTYEPLQKHNPELVAQLELIVHKTGMDIPPERMFLMKASEKVTTLNADVEGYGATKRVVVWDNTVAKAKPDEIMMIFGHESGHYALKHIEQIVPFAIGFTGLMLFVGFHFIQWSIRRFGGKWGIPNQNDWATVALLALAISILGVLSEPIQNGFVRAHEHDADVYGQEVIHGLVQDPQTSATNAFVLLGKLSFADPNPSPLYEFWTYSHPAIGRRAAFAHAYNPWVEGVEPKYFKK